VELQVTGRPARTKREHPLERTPYERLAECVSQRRKRRTPFHDVFHAAAMGAERFKPVFVPPRQEGSASLFVDKKTPLFERGVFDLPIERKGPPPKFEDRARPGAESFGGAAHTDGLPGRGKTVEGPRADMPGEGFAHWAIHLESVIETRHRSLP
jgi:hypothetical protein